jgi:hypothetical protein
MFNFNFGNKKPSIVQYAVVGSILSIIISLLSGFFKIDEKQIWELVDEIQRALHINIVNDIIINDPELLNRRVHRDVDRALDQVTPEYNRIIEEANKKYKPKYMDLENDESLCHSEDCKKLAPPMRLCSPVFETIDCNVKPEDK